MDGCRCTKKERRSRGKEKGPPNFEDLWFPGEATRLFEETRSFVQSRGMKLMRRR